MQVFTGKGERLALSSNIEFLSFFRTFVIFCSVCRLTCRMNISDFQKTVYPLKDKIFRFAKRMVENHEEAEDVVQETFIRLWNKRDDLQSYRSIEALAMTTVKNLCIDKIRARRNFVENLDNHRGYIENIPGSGHDEHTDDMVAAIRRAMNHLPGQQRMIMHLRDIEGYEFEEIAAIAGMNENAVRVALSRARKRIRELLINVKLYEYQRN